MKHFKLFILTLCLIFALSLVSFAEFIEIGDGYADDGEFTVASYNGLKYYNTVIKKHQELEDASWWLLNQKDSLNLKSFSILGQITSGSRNTYTNAVTQKGMTVGDFQKLFGSEPEWEKEFEDAKKAFSPFTDENIPIGASLLRRDYYSSGFNRDSYLAKYFPVTSIIPNDYEYDYFNDYNYYTVVTDKDASYIIYHLELYPTLPAINWFNTTLAEHKDKYAIVYTASMIDNDGKLYTIWDRELGATPSGMAVKTTSECDGINIYSFDKPTDGELTWQKAFDKHDNILAIISSNVTKSEIIAKKFTNSRGIDVAVIGANVSEGYDKLHGPTFLLTKFSADKRTVTCAFATSFKGINTDSVKTVTLDKIGTLEIPEESGVLPHIPTQYNGANKAYIFGYEGNTFRPNANMTRAEACTIFARLLLGTQTIPDGYTTRFVDVKKGDWFYNAIAYLDETGYFLRNKNTTYKPNEPITRAEFVDLANATSSLASKKSVVEFKDVPKEHFYYESIVAAAGSGLVNGYEDSTFRPDNTITRAEVVTVINRLLGLDVSERTVSLSHLENEFVDIGSHWARLNVLMASNSSVHGDYYYSASLNGVDENSTSFIFKNKHFSLTLNKKTGKVTEILNLYNGENINSNSTSPQFLYLTDFEGKKSSPTNVASDGNRLKFTFKDGTEVYLLVDVRDNFMSFEIDSEIPSTYKTVTFANIRTNNTASESPDGYRLSFMGMTAWVNPVEKGYNVGGKACYAHAESIYAEGTMGAKLGVVFSKQSDNVKFLQEVADSIDRKYGLTSKAGGPYALENEDNFGDYVIVTKIDPDNFDETIALAKEMDIDQFDIHQSDFTFRQGDFWFYNTKSGSAKEYYETFGYKLKEAGIQSGLHTYAYYINPKSHSILSQPKWQKDLERMDDTYTLRGVLSKFKASIKTYEDASSFDLTVASFHKNSHYVLIDNEIIYVGATTPEGFIKCQRGQCGTTAAQHEDGAKIYHLSGYFTLLVPEMGSDLFYHIADLTAKAYNDGGFEMLYLDAIDGIAKHLEQGEEKWYYYQTFVQRILSQLNNDPVLEFSDGAPLEWNVRGRRGAWDTTAHGIKRSIDAHVNSNKSSLATKMTATLGWFSFFPDQNPTSDMKNTIEKTIFRDDIDYLGVQALIYDMSMVYNPFSVADIKNNPFHYDNVCYYVNLYTKLRKSHYFTAEALEKVKSIGGEWKVIEKNNGEYTFLQMHYNAANLGNLKDERLVFNAENKFEKQAPFIRIESRYSTMFEDPKTLTKFDEEKPLDASVLTKPCVLNMTDNMIMSVRIKGTGIEGDAILISLQTNLASSSMGRTDHFVDVSFDGWREVILLDADNAEYDTDKYVFEGIDTESAAYATYRFIPGYSNINKVTVRSNTDTASKVCLGEMIAYKQTDAPVKNPSIKVGSQTITFNCELRGGEYLEYSPDTQKAILYHNATQTKEEVSFNGTLELDSGAFEVEYSAEAQTEAPVRARVVLGFAGQEITN